MIYPRSRYAFTFSEGGERGRLLPSNSALSISMPLYPIFYYFGPSWGEDDLIVQHPLGKVWTQPGIGLAIVARASQHRGGACGVESKIGERSCFWLELRLER